MAKCKSCGAVNPDGNRFCSRCGTRFPSEADNALNAALQSAETEFEQASMMTLDRSRITYVCELCGTVNRIDQEKCARCGKPRPRSEYVAALKKIKESETYRKEAAVALPQEEAPSVQTPMEEPADRSDNGQMTLYRFEPDAMQQGAPVVQPFVVVPYVNPHQPVLQYQPQQAYRFEPYTPAEADAIRNADEAYRNGAPATPDQLNELRNKKLEELRKLDAELASLENAVPEKVDYLRGARKVRIVSTVSAVFGILFVVLSLLLSMGKGSGIEVLKSLGNCLDGAMGLSVGVTSQAYDYVGALSFLAPCGLIAALIAAVVSVIIDVVKICSGRSAHRNFVGPAIVTAGSAVMFAGLAITDVDLFAAFPIGAIVAVVLGIALIVVAAFVPVNNRRKEA